MAPRLRAGGAAGGVESIPGICARGGQRGLRAEPGALRQVPLSLPGQDTGPKIPDRFAAVHCSAAAPTDGTISARTLRTTRLTFMVGENDNDYGRRERCEKFDAEVRKLKEHDKGDYPVEFELKQGHGHTG